LRLLLLSKIKVPLIATTATDSLCLFGWLGVLQSEFPDSNSAILNYAILALRQAKAIVHHSQSKNNFSKNGKVNVTYSMWQPC
jgi:hypothetical protein